MKRLSWFGVVLGFLMLGSMAGSAQVAVVIGPRPVFVPRPPVVVRPVAVYPAPVVAYRPVYRPVIVPRPYYPVARPVVLYGPPVFYRPGPARRAYWRHERWEHRHGRW